ncbi:MAG: LPS export ABC transporter permease LptF [Deltaproteobacteria bacterium]|nr:MAG: LPS export ABC transporter permease LptF [Deltaproteobacteria bacterium]
MTFNSIINRYIFRELLPPFALNIVFFTFVFLMTKILNITDMIINYHVGLGIILKMIAYFIPFFLGFVIPIAVMMSVLLTFLRMSGDNEVIALRAGGVSIYSLLTPVIVFSLLGALLTFWVSTTGLLWGRLGLKQLTYDVAASNLNIGIKSRQFSDDFNGVTIYVNSIDPRTGNLEDVFIEDRRDKRMVSTIVAPRAVLFNESDGLEARARLFDGTLNQVNLKGQTVNSIKFGVYDLRLDLKRAPVIKHNKRKSRKEMNLAELRNYLRNAKEKNGHYYSILITYYNKFAIPVTCISLGLLAVPLGVLASGLRKSFGLGLGMFFLFINYALMSAGKVFGEAGIYPPIIGTWMPNLVTLLVAGYFFYRSADNRTFRFNWRRRRGQKVR